MPDALLRPVLRCARGEIAPNVALMQLLTESPEAAVEQALSNALTRCDDQDGPAPQRLAEALALLHQSPNAGETVRSIMAHVDHSFRSVEHDVAAHWSQAFDRAAGISPEASVALYTLGSPGLLEAATAEVLDVLEAWDLLRPDYNLLEIGCGIGRFLQPLSRRLRLVIGIDVSPAMLRIARERSEAANVGCIRTSGHDLSAFANAAFDIVTAIDVFPYFQASEALLEQHMREAHRVLKPHGRLLLVNFSYRADDDRDRDDLHRLGAASGFHIIRNGQRPFRYWDGLVFLLRRTD